jgi:hypothetical protein
MLNRLVFGLVCLATLSAPAVAMPVVYSTLLTGSNESPANASPGTGTAEITIDAEAHTMRVVTSFSGLMAGVTASHIHVINGPGDGNTTDTNGPVVTTVPTFPGFPGAVTFGSYDNTFNMTLAGSYNPAFVTAAGGLATAESAFFSGIASGRAYLNIHTSTFPGGEIRGFFQPVPEPATLLLLSSGIGGLVLMRRRRRM